MTDLIPSAIPAITTLIVGGLVGIWIERQRQRTEIRKTHYADRSKASALISASAAVLYEAASDLEFKRKTVDNELSYDGFICSAENRDERMVSVYREYNKIMKSRREILESEIESSKAWRDGVDRRINYMKELLVERYIKDGMSETLARLRAESVSTNFPLQNGSGSTFENEKAEEELMADKVARRRLTAIDEFIDAQDRFDVALKEYELCSVTNSVPLIDGFTRASENYMNAICRWAFENYEDDENPRHLIARRLDELSQKLKESLHHRELMKLP